MGTDEVFVALGALWRGLWTSKSNLFDQIVAGLLQGGFGLALDPQLSLKYRDTLQQL